MTKRFQSLWLLSASFLTLSCAKIEIKDEPVYWPAGKDGAVVTHLVSEGETLMPKPEFDAMLSNQLMACISGDTFAWFRATIEKACADAKGLCTVEDKKKLGAFFKRADKVRRRGKK